MDYSFGVAPHQDAPHRTHSPATHDEEPDTQLVAQCDDLVGGPPSPEVGLRDGNPGGLDLLHLLVEDLLTLTPALSPHELVGVGARHIVRDVDQMELRSALGREVDCR